MSDSVAPDSRLGRHYSSVCEFTCELTKETFKNRFSLIDVMYHLLSGER